jgi:dihydrofolate reductase
MKVFIIAAITANGFIARNRQELANWTSKEDKKLFVELTKRAGVMVMGSTTYSTIGRPLPGRRTIVYAMPGFEAEGVEITAEDPHDLVRRLAAEGCQELAICGGSSIYTMFLDAGLVDELFLSIEPIMFAGGVPFITNKNEINLALLEERKLNEHTILAHYEVKNNGSTD